jgi:hypothetical protein
MRKYILLKIFLIFCLLIDILIRANSLTESNILSDKHDLSPTINIPDEFSILISNEIQNILLTSSKEENTMQSLIGSFLVSKNKVLYKFRLKQNITYNSTKLTAFRAKRGVETVIKKKLQNYRNLLSIFGAREFLNSKSNEIEGIILDSNDPLSFTIVFINQESFWGK